MLPARGTALTGQVPRVSDPYSGPPLDPAVVGPASVPAGTLVVTEQLRR